MENNDTNGRGLKVDKDMSRDERLQLAQDLFMMQL